MRKAVAFILFTVLLFATALSAASCATRGQADTKKFAKGDTKIIAHRGLSGMKTENTEAAFIAAGERSHYGIEADVRKTADGGFIICHDKTLDKLGVKDVTVEEKTLDELLGITFGKGDKLCTLENYISICQSYGKQAFLELKSSFTEAEIHRIVGIVSELGYLERTTFISFSYTELLSVRATSPEQPVQYLCSKLKDGDLERLKADKIDASIKYTNISANIIERLHEAGLEVGCWTVNNGFIATRLASLGVDYITTDILE